MELSSGEGSYIDSLNEFKKYLTDTSVYMENKGEGTRFSISGDKTIMESNIFNKIFKKKGNTRENLYSLVKYMNQNLQKHNITGMDQSDKEAAKKIMKFIQSKFDIADEKIKNKLESDIGNINRILGLNQEIKRTMLPKSSGVKIHTAKESSFTQGNADFYSQEFENAGYEASDTLETEWDDLKPATPNPKLKDVEKKMNSLQNGQWFIFEEIPNSGIYDLRGKGSNSQTIRYQIFEKDGKYRSFPPKNTDGYVFEARDKIQDFIQEELNFNKDDQQTLKLPPSPW